MAPASTSLLPVDTNLGWALAVLLATAVAVTAAARLSPDQGFGRAREVLTAGVRAAVQLIAVSAVIGWVVSSHAGLPAFLILMYGVAVRTAGRRITANGTWWWAALPIAASVVPAIALLLVTGLVPSRGIAVIPITGILIGGALTATVLAGRQSLSALAQRNGEVEAGLALGMTERDARIEIARPAASDALLPGLDQTRTVGLVTLPGAFVGMLLGGADPLVAGAVQLFVLITLMAIQAVAVTVTLELVARCHITAEEPGGPRATRTRRFSVHRRRTPVTPQP